VVASTVPPAPTAQPAWRWGSRWHRAPRCRERLLGPAVAPFVLIQMAPLWVATQHWLAEMQLTPLNLLAPTTSPARPHAVVVV